MAYDKDTPAVGNVVADDLTAINANWEYIIKGDGTADRVFRQLQLDMYDGTDASTLKCRLVDVWNGDSETWTDNIAKNATTGNYTLSSDGKTLTIEAAALSGNVVAAGMTKFFTVTGTWNPIIYASGNDIVVTMYNISGTQWDLTSVVDVGVGNTDFHIFYITDA